jgi:ATP-dependent Clp protease protease subunit
MKKLIRMVVLAMALLTCTTILNAKSLLIAGTIDNQQAIQTINLILYYDTLQNESIITIYIDTLGGDVSAAYMIADAIKACKKPVETIVMGRCMSAGVIISVAGTKGLRYAFKHAKFLIHEPYCILPVEYNLHDKDAKRFLEGSAKTKKEMIEYFLENTKIDQLSLEKYLDGEMYFDSKQARKWGVIDQIVNYENNPNRKYDGKN